MTVSSNVIPRIYINCLASQQLGHFYGFWVNATQPIENIYKEIRQLLSKSPTNTHSLSNANAFSFTKWEINDVEGFHGIASENDSLERLNNLARGIAKYGSAFVTFANIASSEVTLESFEARSLGSYPSEIDFLKSHLYNDGSYSLDDEINWEELIDYFFSEEFYSVKHDSGKVIVLKREGNEQHKAS